MELRWRRQTLRLRRRFATSQGGIDSKETLVLEIEHEGVIGLGEAAPSRLYGQSLEQSEAAFAALRDELRDVSPFAIDATLTRALAAHDAQRAAVAALDSALHDWVARRLGVPMWRLLGLNRPSVQTCYTIGVAEPAETREKIREALAAGFRTLKVKVGVDSDEQTLAAVRAEFDGPLLLDANEAWPPATARERVRALARFSPTMIEQPLARPNWSALKELRELRVAPIFVDESCERPADVVRLHGCVDGVNVKFTKCGGIREALRMVALARGLGMGVMLGCFVSSSLAIAPALAIAPLFDHCDLDGALLLANDTYRGIRHERGRLDASDEPGLGLSAAGPPDAA